MSINEMVLNSGIRNIADANKALEAYYQDPREREKASAALYYFAVRFSTVLCNNKTREEIITIAVDDLAQDFPKLAANSTSARAFREWCCKRLFAVMKNKVSSYYKVFNRYWDKHVSGDSPTDGKNNLTRFMLLSGPDDEYFAEEEEDNYKKTTIEFYNRVAELIEVEECLSYILGFWCILVEAFTPGLNVPQMYMDGELESFTMLLYHNGVRKETVLRLTAALEKNQRKFMCKPKTYAQAKRRCTDYTRLVRKALTRHEELLHYVTMK